MDNDRHMKSVTPRMMPRRIVHIILLSAVVVALSAPACAADPKVPPAVESGNRSPIAILTTGFDYTNPAIAAHLARDGEGEIIAWDVPGNDRFPYDPAGDTGLMTELAAQIPPDAPISLLAVKVDPNDPVSLAKGLAFITRTPARTVLIPMWSPGPAGWDVFAKASAHFADLKLVLRTCPDFPVGGSEPVFPRDLNLPPAVAPPFAADDPAASIKSYVAALPCRRP